MSSDHTPRNFEVPTALVAAGFGPTTDLDALDREVEFPGAYGDWAEKVLFVENAKTLAAVCGNTRLLPRGLLSSVQLDDGSLLVDGLVDSDGRVWDGQFNAWGVPVGEVDILERTIILDEDEIAFVARALLEGADEVWFRPYIPKAFVPDVVASVVAASDAPADQQGKKPKVPDAPLIEQNVPAGSAIVAVVDPIDNSAVLEMLAITPGPHVLRRHSGKWFEDPEWVSVLKSVKPPKIVKLNEAQVASVSAQVDISTNAEEWEPFKATNREQYQVFTASSYIQKLQQESDEAALFALVAVAGRKVTPKDAVATERLKKYWTVGKGAAKIRWGTPGSWRRCYRHLVKYVGPTIAPGYCTNLSQRLGGPGIATHVGDVNPLTRHIPGSADVLTAANPLGNNGYSNGMTFEESTKGVERDSSGQFAQENGSHSGRFSGGNFGGNAGNRESRRRASMARSKKNRDDKKAKKNSAAARLAEKAKREAQQKQLAQLSLSISEASASGDTLKAAELRVQRAELALSFADTDLERINAQTTLNNARAAYARARVAKRRKSGSPKPRRPSTSDVDKAISDYNKNNNLRLDV